MSEEMNFEDHVAGIADTLVEKEPTPVEEPVVETKAEEVEPSEEVVEAQEDDDLSILDDLLGDDEDETTDDAPEESETESKDEPEEADTTEYTVKVDGEELTVTLDELKKGYGLQQSLTRKGQELADERKKLEAETEAVAWVKASAERKELQSKIDEANEAITRGFVLENGQPVYLTKEQIEHTKRNVEEAVADFQAKNKPPRLDELRERIPDMFSSDERKRQAVLDSHRSVLEEFGYSAPEIAAMDDPRTFLMQQELLELRALRARVDDAKARRKERKAGVVSKTSKSAKSAPVKKQAEAPREVTLDDVHAGNASWADLIESSL